MAVMANLLGSACSGVRKFILRCAISTITGPARKVFPGAAAGSGGRGGSEGVGQKGAWWGDVPRMAAVSDGLNGRERRLLQGEGF